MGWESIAITFATALTIVIIVGVVVSINQIGRKARAYDIAFESEPADLMEMVAMMPFTYQQMLTVAAVIYDLHRELNRPSWCRFISYPLTRERSQYLLSLVDSFSDRMALMEAGYTISKGEKSNG